jgi:hypothetical protein
MNGIEIFLILAVVAAWICNATLLARLTVWEHRVEGDEFVQRQSTIGIQHRLWQLEQRALPREDVRLADDEPTEFYDDTDGWKNGRWKT